MPSTVRPGVEKDAFLDGERPSQVSAGPAAPAQPRDGWGPGKTSRTPRDLVGNGSESSPLAHCLRSWVSLTSKQKAGTEHRVLWGGARRKPQIQEEVELGGKHLHVISRQNISTCLHTTAILGLRRSVIAQRNLQPKKGIWLIQGHTAKVNIHWAACSVPGEGRALVSSASPTPFLLTASPFSTS